MSIKRSYWYKEKTAYVLCWEPINNWPFKSGSGLTLVVVDELGKETTHEIAIDNIAVPSVKEWDVEKITRICLALWIEQKFWDDSQSPKYKELRVIFPRYIKLLQKKRTREEEEEALMRLALGLFLEKDKGNGISFSEDESRHFFPLWMDLERLPTIISMLTAKGYLAKGPGINIDASHAVRIQEQLDQIDAKFRLETKEANGPSIRSQEKELSSIQGHFRVTNLKMENVRVFHSLDLAFEKGQWLVFLGDNGLGKSTILRTLALALVDRELATTALTLLDSKMVSHGEKSASIYAKVDFSDAAEEKPRNITSTLQLGGNGSSFITSTELPTPQGIRLPMVFAYGCRRGSALGGPRRDVDLSPLGAIRTLFDESATVLHAETWLEERYALSLKYPEGKQADFFETIRKTLCRILPHVEDIEVEPSKGVFIKLSFLDDKVPLKAMSDGYLTTVGWMMDLIARWTHNAEEQGISLSDDFTKEMVGIVLLDEIDLHLHPRWQRTIIANLKRCFPNMTFVVTTHNPLTIQGTEPGEVHVLSLNSDPEGKEKVTVEQKDIPSGIRADQILTGDWFGLESTLDENTMMLLKEHQTLLRQTSKNENERTELEQTLRKRLGSFADTSYEKLAWTAVSDVLDEDNKPYQEQSSKEKANTRKNIKARFAEKLKKKRREKKS